MEFTHVLQPSEWDADGVYALYRAHRLQCPPYQCDHRVIGVLTPRGWRELARNADDATIRGLIGERGPAPRIPEDLSDAEPRAKFIGRLCGVELWVVVPRPG